MQKMVRSAFEWFPESVRKEMTSKRAEFRGLGQLKINQSLLANRLAQLEQQQNPLPSQSEVEDPRFPPHVRSRLCTQAQLSEPWFKKWCEAIGEPPLAHRKTWEFAYIAEVLDSLGQLEPGRRGLGFGVGREPLISAFASRGVEVVATDIAPDSKEALAWVRSDQHSYSIETMLRPDVCDPAKFRELVSWRPVDMRAIPKDLQQFDFCWSACALEHLGTLADGLDFIERSISTLAPGGIAVHTTEFNMNSNDKTIEQGPTVVYRERDLMGLKDRLEASGHEVAAFDLSRGEGLLDQYVDIPPYADEPVLRFTFGSYTLTSVAIVVRARPS
jgi:2-polyprenyl-3-methyl-5-hydroxy-6-metoxy-1,4-benzoquinol methylase